MKSAVRNESKRASEKKESRSDDANNSVGIIERKILTRGLVCFETLSGFNEFYC